MKLSKYQIQKRDKLKKKAIQLYKQGLTMRDVASLVGKSRQWVCRAVNEGVHNP